MSDWEYITVRGRDITFSQLFEAARKMSETRAAYNVVMSPGGELDALVARVMGQREGIDFGNLGQHNWSRTDNDYGWPWECLKCGQNDGWASESELEKDGCFLAPKPYSTNNFFAMQAWEWLEENHPWKNDWGETRLFLGRNIEGQPSIFVLFDYRIDERIATGNDYPHAIALAVVEAGKALGVIE